MKDKYEIRLNATATPHALFTARNVPIPHQEKVRDELNCMEILVVIFKVDVATDWCAGMVMVPKKNGSVCICVYLKPLNESILQETHPLPDGTLAQLSSPAVFSRLDANSGFWQTLLAETSQYLNTFNTPFGRYCFNKVPFGISSAPEHFQ